MRIGAIDFWRGAILLVIMIDHVPGNGLEAFTPRNFGLSDSAEAFVFLCGLSVGSAYLKRSLGAAWRACAARAWSLYRVHIGLTLAAIAVFGAAFCVSGAPGLLEAHGRGVVFDDPWRALPGILLTSHQLGYFNILPLYVVLMLMAAPIVALARVSVWRALAASLTLYGAADLTGFNLPNWPQPGGWFFNPFAWQLMFTLGVCAAVHGRNKPLPRGPLALAGALAVVLAGALVVTDAGGFAPGLRDGFSGLVDVQKQRLGFGRVLYFLALAYVIAQSRGLARLAVSRAGEEVRRLGRHSLEVFAFGSLLAALGQALLALGAPGGSPEIVESLAIVYTLPSLIGLFGLARFLEWDGKYSGASKRAPARVLGASGV